MPSARTALKICTSRGTPEILDASPAKWNVFNVIYVVGSPSDYPARAPHGVAGSNQFGHLLTAVLTIISKFYNLSLEMQIKSYIVNEF